MARLFFLPCPFHKVKSHQWFPTAYTAYGPACFLWRFSTFFSFIFTAFSEICESLTACLKGVKDSTSQKTCQQSLQHKPCHSSEGPGGTHKRGPGDRGVRLHLAARGCCVAGGAQRQGHASLLSRKRCLPSQSHRTFLARGRGLPSS